MAEDRHHPPENGRAAVAAHAELQVASKRQRRPSVRLGDIGGDVPSFGRTKSQWKDGETSSKTRHLTNLSSNEALSLTLVNNRTVNASNKDTNDSKVNNVREGDVDDNDDDREGNLENIATGSWKIKDFKSKRGPTTKRVRSNWVSRTSENEGDDKIPSGSGEDLDNNEEMMRGFEPDDSEHSPINSLDHNNVDLGVDADRGLLGSRRRVTRVSEDGPSDTEARNWNVSSERNGVKVWLNQLGLGRYAPVFEIHEVDDEVLPMLTLEDLKDMGINAVGSRRKMYCSIQKLSKGFS